MHSAVLNIIWRRSTYSNKQYNIKTAVLITTWRRWTCSPGKACNKDMQQQGVQQIYYNFAFHISQDGCQNEALVLALSKLNG
jgi:hypothetical protein